MKTLVIVTTTFDGTHCWPDAPDPVAFLRNIHRHQFQVRVAVHEDHNFTVDTRETEFFLLQALVRGFLPRLGVVQPLTGIVAMGCMSCEMMAKHIMDYLSNKGYVVGYVEVFEDGENGARVEP